MIYLGTFSKILSPGLRLGWAVAPRPVLEKLNLGKQGADLCSSPVTQMFVAAYFAERGAWRPAWLEYVERLRDLYRRRRDVMLEALQEHFGERASWTRPQGGLFIWATLDERHRHDRPARARRSEGVAFVPGRAAYMDGRSGGSSMRLNFAGVPEHDIREGITPNRQDHGRRQLGLLGTLTGSPVRPAERRARRPSRRRRQSRARRSPTSSRCRAASVDRPGGAPHDRIDDAPRKKVAVLKGGRSLERTVSLRSGAQVQDALERLGHEVLAIDVGPELVAQLHEREPDAAFVALHGRDGEDGTVQELLEAIGIRYTGSGPAACMRCTDKVLAKHLMREAGIPTPDFHAFKESAIKELGAAAALGDVERTLGFPLVVKPASQGSALGVKFARSSEELPAAIVGALSYDRKVADRALRRGARPGGIGARRRAPRTAQPPALALPIVEAIPREEDFYDYESRYEIGMTTFVCPAELPAETTARAQELALATYELLGCHGFARVDLMLDQRHRRAVGAGDQRRSRA